MRDALTGASLSLCPYDTFLAEIHTISLMPGPSGYLSQFERDLSQGRSILLWTASHKMPLGM